MAAHDPHGMGGVQEELVVAEIDPAPAGRTPPFSRRDRSGRGDEIGSAASCTNIVAHQNDPHVRLRNEPYHKQVISVICTMSVRP
jgi:hypothetical protein